MIGPMFRHPSFIPCAPLRHRFFSLFALRPQFLDARERGKSFRPLWIPPFFPQPEMAFSSSTAVKFFLIETVQEFDGLSRVLPPPAFSFMRTQVGRFEFVEPRLPWSFSVLSAALFRKI